MLVESVATSQKSIKMPFRRIFVAIDISEDVRARVTAYISQLRFRFPDVSVKWELPKKLHLTMWFVGNVDDAGLEEISSQVESAAGFLHPFKITISGTGAFENRGKAVLWIGAEAVDAAKYQDPFQRIAALLALEGVPKRRFRPHLTIGRIKNSREALGLINAHREQKLDAGTYEVNSLVIYESRLLPSGSVYSVVSKYPFRG
jgi:RNA 2',3'-cyclic 3'-phosphodiesterase